MSVQRSEIIYVTVYSFNRRETVNMKTKIVVLLIIAVFTSLTVMAVQNQGNKTIKLNGGYKGIVDFPHYLHQDSVNNCNVCHSIFPKTEGVIKRLRAEGKLTKKQVMNKLCIKCHKEKTGPTKCSKCHTKN